jgi:hypothetical protein
LSKTITTDRKKNAIGKHWSAKDRVRAVASYLVLGNMAAVSDETGIPLGTLNYWKTQPWWFEQISRIHQEEDMDIQSTFTKIVKKTQGVIMDRIENGDYYVDKDGKVSRRPVSMRDAALVGAISVDKRKILRDIPATEQNKIGMQERLKNLESEFRKLVHREESIIDITAEVVNGEAELQTGVCDRVEGEAASAVDSESSEAGDDQAGEGEGGGREGRGAQESPVEGRDEQLGQPANAETIRESFFRPS